MPAQRGKRPFGTRRLERRAEGADRGQHVHWIVRRRDRRRRPVVARARTEADGGGVVEFDPQFYESGGDIDGRVDLEVGLQLCVELQNVRPAVERRLVQMFDAGAHLAVAVSDGHADNRREDQPLGRELDRLPHRESKGIGIDPRGRHRRARPDAIAELFEAVGHLDARRIVEHVECQQVVLGHRWMGVLG